jgi:ferredoxin-thioredoxin reductase catalytic subunit
MDAKTPEELEEGIREFAEEHNYVVDEEALGMVVKGLQANYQKHGSYYCPCRRVKPDDPAYLLAITCPCASVHDDIAMAGCCQCRLYWKTD